MSPFVVAIVAGIVVAVGAWTMGAGPASVVLILPFGLLGFVRARQMAAVLGDESTSAPPMVTRDKSIDIGEELLDLLTSARQRATRSLEDRGRLEPFVMYEDAGGDVRIRRIDADPSMELTRAREAARMIDDTAPRLVLAVTDRVDLDGRMRTVVRYEAAERRFRDRTLVFVQPIRSRLLVVPATTEGLPIYVGDGDHTLRFSATD